MSALTLAIEVSNPSADAAGGGAACAGDITGPSVALARGPHVFEQEALRTADARHDDDLMPAIDRMVRRAGLAAADLERVAVSIGPGGFTGLRVAIATAKAIGEAIVVRRGLAGDAARVCTGVPSAHVAALNRALREQEAGRGPSPCAVALASKRETAWVTVFGDQGPIDPGRLASATELDEILTRRRVRVLIADRFLPASMRERAAALGMEVTPPVFSAAACALLAARMPGVEPASLLPLYPREPEAVTKWRQLHGEP